MISEISQLNDRKRNLIFINLVVSGVASSTLSTAMATALPNLVEYFGVSTSIGQWVTSGYSLAMGVGVESNKIFHRKYHSKS